MLVLDRKLGEEFTIGGNIRVKILSIQGGRRVKVGVDAPADVEVLRQELIDLRGQQDSHGVDAEAMFAHTTETAERRYGKRHNPPRTHQPNGN